MVFLDPTTRQRQTRMKHTGDMNYDLVGDAAISEEVVPVIGPWQDFTGSDATINSRQQQQFAGRNNELWGEDPQVEHGADLDTLDVTGHRKETTRRRQIKRNVDFVDGKRA